MKLFSAFFYGFSSFLITVVNKSVLSIYKFPSVLVLCVGQMLAGMIILLFLDFLRIIQLQNCSMMLLKSIMPLPLFYIGNIVFGLGGTQALNLPMFVELRKTAILKTMILEYFLLGTRPALSIQIVVFGMLFGSLLAVIDDATFSFYGYVYVMIANLVNALNAVYIKKKFCENKIDQYDLIYFNSLVSILPILLIAIYMSQVEIMFDFQYWTDWKFCAEFTLSCVLGFVLIYSTNMCTNYNSALTTSVVGCIKNILITYLGMIYGNDYIFSWLNFIGLNISVFCSTVYVYLVFSTQKVEEEKSKVGQI